MKRFFILLFLLFVFSLYAENTNVTTDTTGDTLVDTTKVIKHVSAENVKAYDTPDDAGGTNTVEWTLNADLSTVDRIEIWRRMGQKGSYAKVAEVPARMNQYVDKIDKEYQNEEFYYFVRVVYKDGQTADSKVGGPAIPKAQWFNKGRLPTLVLAILISAIFLLYLNLAKKGRDFYIRMINGLEAVEEAVGRATEMGKPIMYILGLGYVTDIPTIAGLTILGKVAQKAAEYDTRIIVPNYDPVVMTTAQEVVKEAFVEAGRPDAFRKDDVFYLTQDQFGYAAGVDGLMVREKPGAVFFQGIFYAESLIMAETGNSIGAIQIAGTTETAQLPFFVAACDYTLIGEEMLAASCYLSRDPVLLGTIVAEDYIKIATMILIVLSFIIGTIGYLFHFNAFISLFEWIKSLF